MIKIYTLKIIHEFWESNRDKKSVNLNPILEKVNTAWESIISNILDESTGFGFIDYYRKSNYYSNFDRLVETKDLQLKNEGICQFQ